ncbi:MAG: c-type cytochrome [Myxococcaceae bacterium]|nr:c-type cytochrome [Myxococcaceae bacterium]
MKYRFLVAALTFVFVAGCAGKSESYASSAGSLAASRDEAFLYAADADWDKVFVIDAATEKKVAEINVGKTPEHVLVGPDDTLYVTARYGRGISVVGKGDFSNVRAVETGIEPSALALSNDGRTLYVVNSTTLTDALVGSVVAIDTATLQIKWELPVGEEPSGIAVLSGERALVSLLKQGDVVLVDLGKQKVLKNYGGDVYAALNDSLLNPDPASPSRKSLAPDVGFNLPTVKARGIQSLAVSPDGHRVVASALLATQAVLSTSSGGSPLAPDSEISVGGGGYGGGSCGAGSVVTPALLSFDESGTPRVDDVSRCEHQASDTPATVLTNANNNLPIQGPKAVVLDATGSFAFIVNTESDNVAVVPTSRQASTNNQNSGAAVDAVPAPRGGTGSAFNPSGSVPHVIATGKGPTGLVLSKDGKRAWVYSLFDHSLHRLEGRGSTLARVSSVNIASDILEPDVARGRQLFFSATDSRMNDPGRGISCGSCHINGREDGHVWNFIDGPRQTPTLAGGRLKGTAPFHWNGEFENLGAFMALTVRGRMGGTGVTPEMETQLEAFINSQPAADNPHRLASLSPAQERGQQVFAKAECNTCHAGEALTDNKFANVGTFVTQGNVQDDAALIAKGLNTPPLLGLARTAPYLHDGSASTLKARILNGKERDLHGKTAQLSNGEVDDLVEYLKTL